MAESIDKARLGLHMQVELFDDGGLTITDTSDDPYLPTFTNIRAAGAARLLDFLLVHKERLSRYTEPEDTENEAERYNREMDARNRATVENRDKPWLPIRPGEEF